MCEHSWQLRLWPQDHAERIDWNSFLEGRLASRTVMLYPAVQETLKFGRGKSGSSSAPPRLDWGSWMDCMLILTLTLEGEEELETCFSTERRRIHHIAILILCSGDILAFLPHISLVSSYTASMKLVAG